MKTIVNLVPRSVKALDKAKEVTGDGGTDVINRAVQLYAYLMVELDDEREIWIHDPVTGTARKLVLM